jgi:hypothetical protein
MEIPRFWAEHRLRHPGPEGREIGIARYGWSQQSQVAAEAHALQRAQLAVRELEQGRAPTRRERKVAYAGSDGLPIREEIVAEYAECAVVVTRNRYGAHCLNVPDTLFADVDLGNPRELRAGLRAALVTGLVLTVGSGFTLAGELSAARMLVALIGIVALLLAVRSALRSWKALRSASDPALVSTLVGRWCEDHPAWCVHIYRTPAGYRLLATHARLDPCGAEAAEFFAFVGGDPTYRLMCRKQACYRARLTAKPWRIGMPSRLPRALWPIANPVTAERRAAWVVEYEARSAAFAACDYVGRIGMGRDDGTGAAVRALHDRLARVGQGLPIA